jgi:hypothetical protein
MKLLVYYDTIINIISTLTKVLLFTTVASHSDRFMFQTVTKQRNNEDIIRFFTVSRLSSLSYQNGGEETENTRRKDFVYSIGRKTCAASQEHQLVWELPGSCCS